MAYTINNTRGTQLASVSDGTINTSLGVTLVGKNYAGYGQIQNENFVYLLENFASTTPPNNPIAGQIWFDVANNKLKFFDKDKVARVANGATSGETAPSGLSQGDFWFNTATNQLFAYTGSTYTLVGPQSVSGSGTTQMQSVSVQDTNGASHAIIKATDNGQVIFIVSADGAFTLNNTINPITGFTEIQQGVTLCYTHDDTQPGVTTTNHKFWGTASNSEKLGGLPATSYVQTGNASFSTLVSFPDVGFTIGSPISRLKIYNNGSLTPTIQNQVSDTIVFQTTLASQTQTPLTLVGPHILPGLSSTTNLGSSQVLFANVYANKYYGVAEKADALSVNQVYMTASMSSTANTIAVRDSNANITANIFNGTATAANYADLAEKYLPDADYDVGTVLKVGGEKEVTAAGFGDLAIGVISQNPAFMMNKDLAGGVYVALKGRVPVKVIGPVSKGDQMMPTGSGYARKIVDADTPRVFAVALEDSDGTDVRLVECLIL